MYYYYSVRDMCKTAVNKLTFMCRVRDHKLGTSFHETPLSIVVGYTSVTSIHKPVRNLEKKGKKKRKERKTEYGNGHFFPGFVALLERIESKGV